MKVQTRIRTAINIKKSNSMMTKTLNLTMERIHRQKDSWIQVCVRYQRVATKASQSRTRSSSWWAGSEIVFYSLWFNQWRRKAIIEEIQWPSSRIRARSSKKNSKIFKKALYSISEIWEERPWLSQMNVWWKVQPAPLPLLIQPESKVSTRTIRMKNARRLVAPSRSF